MVQMGLRSKKRLINIQGRTIRSFFYFFFFFFFFFFFQAGTLIFFLPWQLHRTTPSL